MIQWLKSLWPQRKAEQEPESVKFPLLDPDASPEDIAAFLAQDEDTQLRQYKDFLDKNG